MFILRRKRGTQMTKDEQIAFLESEIKRKDEALYWICNDDNNGEYGHGLSLDEWMVEVATKALSPAKKEGE